MLKTLERYQKCNYGAPEPNVSAREALVFKFSFSFNFLCISLSLLVLNIIFQNLNFSDFIKTIRFVWQLALQWRKKFLKLSQSMDIWCPWDVFQNQNVWGKILFILCWLWPIFIQQSYLFQPVRFCWTVFVLLQRWIN